jgi:WD40 repeat protein
MEVIAAAYEPLTAKQISEYLDENIEQVQELLAKGKRLLPCWDGSYTFSHSLVFDWLTGKTGQTHSYSLNELGGRRRIANKLLSDFRNGRTDRKLLSTLLPYIIGSQNLQEAKRLISSFSYIQVKCTAGLHEELIEEYATILNLMNRAGYLNEKTLKQAQWLRLIQATLQYLPREIIQDKCQLSGQLIGRLLFFEKDVKLGEFASSLLSEIRKQRDVYWLRPLLPTLVPPGGALLQSLSGHFGKITTVIMSPDGRRIISASEDASIKVFDLDRGTNIYNLHGHSKKVNAVVVTPDGQRLISASHDKTLKIWDLQTGVELDSLQGHSSYVNAITVTPDGKRAISASSDTTLRLWNIDMDSTSHTNIGNWRDLGVFRGHSDSVEKVIITPDGSKAVSSAADKTIRIWDLHSGRQLHILRGHQSVITILAVTPDGGRIVSSSIEDYSLKFWDINTGLLLYTLRGHSNSIFGFAMTTDGRWAVSSSGDKTIKVWRMTPGLEGDGQEVGAVELFTLKGHTSYVRAVAIASKRELVISGSGDKMIKIWDLMSGNELRTLQGHDDSVNSVLVTPDEGRVISASMDNMIKIWDMSYGLETCLSIETQLALSSGHSDVVNAISVTPDGGKAVSASSDGTIKIWNISTGFSAGKAILYIPGNEAPLGKELLTIRDGGGAIYGITFTPDRQHVISVGNGIHVWNLENGKEASIKFDAHEWIYSAVVTQDGHWIISGSLGHSLKVWDMQTGRYLGLLGEQQDRVSWVRSLAITPDSRWVISAGQDKTLKVWDWKIGREVGMLRGHTAGVGAVMVTPNGRQVISGSDDGSVRIWDLESGHIAHILRGHSGAVRAVAVTREGKRVISASEDQSIKVWDIEEGRLLASFKSDGKMFSCAVAPDGNTIIAGGGSGRVHFFKLESPQSATNQ